MQVVKSGRKNWLMDTGCGNDLIGSKVADKLGLSPRMSSEAMTFMTANGVTKPSTISSSLKVGPASLSGSSHKEPVDNHRGSLRLLLLLPSSRIPFHLSVSEPFSAGAEPFGCLNLQSFPVLHVPFFQNEQTPSFLGRSPACMCQERNGTYMEAHYPPCDP